MRCAITAALVIVAGLLFSMPAHADLSKPKSPEARKHLEQGNQYYRVREFDKAIKEYKAGAVLEDVPIFLYDLGQAYRQLGKYEEAIWYYRRYLSHGNVEGEVRLHVQNFIDVMKAEMEKAARDKQPTDPEPRDKPTPARSAESRLDLVTTEPAPERWYHDKIGWGLAGGGLLVAGVGGGFLLSASSLDDQADRETDSDERIRLRDKASSRRTTGAVLAITGVATLAGGIVKLAMYPRKRATSKSGVEVSFALRSVVVQGRF